MTSIHGLKNNRRLFLSSSGDLCKLPDYSVLRKRLQFCHYEIKATYELRATIRADKHSWPGGYPLYYVCGDGESLCATCVRKEYRLISAAIRDKAARSSWFVVGVQINYEDLDLFCAHCNQRIESAYAEDNTKEAQG
jgi:hypothetical protein